MIVSSLASAALGLIAPRSPAATPAAATPAPAPAAKPSADQARLHKAAQAFEAIFVREMLSSARAAKLDTGSSHDPGNATFTAMRDERLADIAAQSGAFGLARQVEAQLSAQTHTLASGAGKASGAKGPGG